MTSVSVCEYPCRVTPNPSALILRTVSKIARQNFMPSRCKSPDIAVFLKNSSLRLQEQNPQGILLRTPANLPTKDYASIFRLSNEKLLLFFDLSAGADDFFEHQSTTACSFATRAEKNTPMIRVSRSAGHPTKHSDAQIHAVFSIHTLAAEVRAFGRLQTSAAKGEATNDHCLP